MQYYNDWNVKVVMMYFCVLKMYKHYGEEISLKDTQNYHLGKKENIMSKLLDSYYLYMSLRKRTT